jgi:hypothetical protein
MSDERVRLENLMKHYHPQRTQFIAQDYQQFDSSTRVDPNGPVSAIDNQH